MSATACAENQALKDHVKMLQIQLETVNNHKQRLMQDNSNEKVAYENTINQLSSKNRALQAEIDEMRQNFENMEDQINELSKKEQEKR